MLHLAAERNFVHVARSLVEQCRGLLYLYTDHEEQDDKRPYLPVEMALMEFNDEVASYLITLMDNEWWVGLNLLQFTLDGGRWGVGGGVRSLVTGDLIYMYQWRWRL